MFNLTNLKKITSIGSLAILMTSALAVAPSISAEEKNQEFEVKATGYITPNSFSKKMSQGEKISLERTVTVNIEDIVNTITTTSNAPEKLDVLFLADNTDSMGEAIENVQENAESLLQNLVDKYDDVQVGVARYYGDPQEKQYSYKDTGKKQSFSRQYTYRNAYKTCRNAQGKSYTCYKYDVVNVEGKKTSKWTTYVSLSRFKKYGDFHKDSGYKAIKEKIEGELGALGAYDLQESVNGGDVNDAIAAINDWGTSKGGDWEEGSFFALHQAATSGAATTTGYETGYQTNWRDDAKKIIVWFGDAKSHTNTVNQAEAIQALKDQGITVLAIHTNSTAISLTEGLNSDLQASSIGVQTGGQFASVYSSELAETILNLIGTAAVETKTTVISPAIDLVFTSRGLPENMEVTYTCIDPRGCNQVKNNDSRNFRMDITANQGGYYDFKTIVNGVEGAEADNYISVNYSD